MAFLLHHLLLDSAARYPEKEAVRFDGRGLSYAELDSLTNQVARALKAAGVRRGDRVGIYVQKSFASIISIFGILKAGGVYVPLDPGAPVKRLAYITRNCGIKVLLSSPEKLSSLPQFLEEQTPLEIVLLTDEPGKDAPQLPDSVQLVGWREVLQLDNSPLPENGNIEKHICDEDWTGKIFGRSETL